MHVLLIHQAFAGPDDPGGTRHYEFGRHLIAQGHRFTVIASAVNYLTGKAVVSAAVPLPEGMTVIRVAGGKNIHRSYAARVRAFAGFAIGALHAARRLRQVDVVWGTSPPLTQLLPAWLVSRRCSGGLVFEERDLWPEFAVGMGVLRDGALARAALTFKRAMYARARRVIVNSPGFLPFLDRYGVAREKVAVIPNGVDTAQFDVDARGEEFRRAWAAEDRFVVLYAGALGPANGLEVVLDAAERLRGTRALFVLLGDGKARPMLEAEAATRRLDNVRFVPPQPKRLMPRVLAAADSCVATLKDIPLFRTTYPNKVFDYMAAGRPVLLGIGGVIREVVESAGAGVCFEPGDARAFAAGVQQLLEQPALGHEMGRRARAAVCERFDRLEQARSLESLIASLAGGGIQPRPVVSARVVHAA